MKPNQTGSVAVVVALILTLLLGVMAFSMDTGYLYLKKNQYQNAVEAAAMAGAVDLCGDDPEATARWIAEQNGIDDVGDEDVLQVSLGYYDENDVYSEDFSEYKDFEADPDPETPENEAVLKIDGDCCQYNNAVMVVLRQKENTLTGGLSGETSTITIKATAVAYLRRYGMIALGDDGISTAGAGNWINGYPQFQDQVIHSNSHISFRGTESFSGDGSISAVDEISNGSGTTGVDPIETPPSDWEELQDDALANGLVFHPADWPEGDSGTQGDWEIDERGNEYVRDGTIYFFCPGEGDFDGATYLFQKDEENSTGTLVIANEETWRVARECRNLTIASEMDTTKIGQFTTAIYTLRLTLGGPGSDAMRLYAKGDIVFRDRYGGYSPVAYQCNGLTMIGEKEALVQTTMHRSCTDTGQHRLRIVADSIVFQSHAVSAINSSRILFDGLFGPPCPPRFVKLGRLVASE